MTGDWAYDALVPIGGLGSTIFGLPVALSVICRRHCLFRCVITTTKRVPLGDQGSRGPSDEDTGLVSLICAPGSAWHHPFPANFGVFAAP